MPTALHMSAIVVRRRAVTLLASSISFVAFAPLVQAQAGGDTKAYGLEEVIVTAQRRAERLQDVPVSISVLGGAELDRSTGLGVTDALTRVPGVSLITGNQSGGSQISVRGVAANGQQFLGPSPIAYYLDAVPFGFVKTALAPDANAYDLDHVEVLRGPQGTLYGSSALNGVVRVLTKDANLDEFELKARTAGSETSGGGENYRGDVAINVPVIDGKLAVRAIGGYESWSGWVDRPDNEDVNDIERRSVRLKVNAQPTDQLSIGLSGWSSRSEYDAPSTADGRQRQTATLDESIAADYDVYSLSLNYDFGPVTLTGTSSYIDYQSDGGLDLGPLGLVGTLLDTKLNSRVAAQELYLRSNQGDHWRWTLGGMYRDAQDRNYQWRRQYVTPALWRESSLSTAVFGELTRVLADGRFELTGGVRYFEDDVKLRETSRSTGIAPGQGTKTDHTYTATSPRVVMAWHPNEDATVYASYSEGFRSGFDQNPATRAAAPALPTAEADTLSNYEIGAKTSLLDSRLSVDAAVYYIDWRDVQLPLSVTILGTPFAAVVNSESASGLGADLGLRLRPVDGLQFDLSASWNDLEVDKNVVSAGTAGVPVTLFAAGDRLNYSPRYTAGAGVDYVFPLGSGGYEGQFSASGTYMSEIVTKNLIGVAVQTKAADEMITGRVAFSVDAPAHWAASVFVDNVTNEDGRVSPGVAASGVWDVRIRPRTVGLQLEWTF